MLSSTAEEICTTESLEQLMNFFQTQLTENPRPSWQLLHHLLDKIDGVMECRRLFVDIALDSLKELIISGRNDDKLILNLLDSSKFA